MAFAAVDRDRARLHRWLPWVPHIRTVAEEQRYFERVEEFWDAHEQFHWLIFDKATHAYVGIVGTARLDWSHGLAEFGYWLVGDFEGQGRMTEAVKRVQHTLFAMGFHRLEIRCSSGNTRSSSIPKRLGYHLDGRLREDRMEQGARVDTLIWSQLRTERARLSVT